MKEYIERQAVIKHLDNLYDNMNAMGAKFYQGFQLARHNVNDYPAADVVEVIRCKDCVCGYKTQNGQIICKFLEAGNFIPYVKPNDYCSYGEWKMDKEK